MKTAIITGATRGIGKVISEYFLSLDYNLVACSKSEESTRKFESSFPHLKKRLLVMPADVSQEEEVKKVLKESLERFRRVDVLINNAGIYGPIGETFTNDSAAWVQAMAVNCFGVFYMCKHLLPHMINNNFGRIINLSGGGANTPMPKYSAYSASKAAVVRLTETIALEVKNYNITLNAIGPGFVATDIHQATLDTGEERVGDFYRKTKERISSGGDDPMLTARLAAYLASEECHLTGKLLSAVHDDWKNLSNKNLSKDLYTLRRIDNFFFKELKNA